MIGNGLTVELNVPDRTVRKVKEAPLLALVEGIMSRVGCNQTESAAVARHLVDANLSGHESHGVLRIVDYVEWIRIGAYVPNRSPITLMETESVLLLDADFGIGQVVAERAVKAGISKAKKAGIALVGIRNAGHLGRVGAWAEMAALSDQASLHFVNGPAGLVVAPFGGSDRRLATTPIAMGIPTTNGRALVYDASTSIASVGKVQLARNLGAQVPAGWIIDRFGRPSTDPEDFFSGGALLPMGGHKGFGLSVLADILIGVITGGGASSDTKIMQANMLSIYISLDVAGAASIWREEIERFIGFVKSSPPIDRSQPVRLPGEAAQEERIKRRSSGIPIDNGTWKALKDAIAAVGIDDKALDGLV